MIPIHVRFAQYFLKGLLFVLTFGLFYYLLCLILPLVTVNGDALIKKSGILIYVAGDDLHTEIIIPRSNEVYQWDEFIEPTSNASDSSQAWISFGFAEKGFYTESHSWTDIAFSKGFVALSGLGNSIMHCSYETAYPFNRKFCRKVFVSKEQYMNVCQFIKESFETEGSTKPQAIPEASYRPEERIYKASHSFHLFNTCNTWTNQILKQIRFKTGIWTALPQGIKEQFAF